MKKFETNVYVIRHKSLVVYVGKGTGNRWLSKKNEWFNKFDEDLNFERKIEKVFRDKNQKMADKLAETYESKLIRKYKPIFNLNEGLTPQKYIEGSELTLADMVDSLIENADGNGVLEPRSIANKMVNDTINIKERDILVIGNKGYAGINLLNRTSEMNPNSNITFLTPGDADYVYIKLSDELKERGIKIMKTEVLSYLENNFKGEFDYIIGNPPYQRVVGTKTENIWAEITVRLFHKLKKNGTMTMIHPSGWRMLRSGSKNYIKEVNEIYTTHKIEYMEFNSYSKGLGIFGASTDFDIISVKKSPVYGKNLTKIKTELDGEVTFDIKDKLLIPTNGIKIFKKLSSKDEKLDVMYSRGAYGSDKPHISKIKDETYKYPVLYAWSQKNGFQFIYSNTKNNGHFGIPKLIIKRGAYEILEDYDGKYGIAQYAIGITDSIENLKKMKIAMETLEFKRLSNDFIGIENEDSITDFNGHHEKFIREFSKDFWKEFVES